MTKRWAGLWGSHAVGNYVNTMSRRWIEGRLPDTSALTSKDLPTESRVKTHHSASRRRNIIEGSHRHLHSCLFDTVCISVKRKDVHPAHHFNRSSMKVGYRTRDCILDQEPSAGRSIGPQVRLDLALSTVTLLNLTSGGTGIGTRNCPSWTDVVSTFLL
jgi:hypothetical protein